jgi:hypothetical protein
VLGEYLYICESATATLKKTLFAPGSRITSFVRHPKVMNLCAAGTVKGEVWLYNCDTVGLYKCVCGTTKPFCYSAQRQLNYELYKWNPVYP